ncbi:hypothetical protein HY008_00670 [Candidatus Woesebacteria bacterium]|nr:hypothetical protein [Candidatus Woesebacteria bacterium]
MSKIEIEGFNILSNSEKASLGLPDDAYSIMRLKGGIWEPNLEAMVTFKDDSIAVLVKTTPIDGITRTSLVDRVKT